MGIEIRAVVRQRTSPPTPAANITLPSRRDGRDIVGGQFWLWRAVDDEGEVLDLLVQRRRDKAAAVKLMRKLLKKQGFAPDVLVTDKLRSYGAAKVESDCRRGTSKGCGGTIGPRIRISRYDGGSARCNASRAQDRCRLFPTVRGVAPRRFHDPGERVVRLNPELARRVDAAVAQPAPRDHPRRGRPTLRYGSDEN
jgi:DDE domain